MYNIAMEKENQVENVKKKTSLWKKLSKIWFVLFNFGYIVAYTVYTAYAIVNKHMHFEWLQYVLGAFIVVYWGVLIATLVSGSKQKYKSVKKDYKSSFKIIKKVLKVANLILTATMVANTIMYDKKNMFAFVLTCISIAYILLQIITEIIKFVRRKKKLKVKEEKAKLKKELVENIKNVINTENENADESEKGNQLAELENTDNDTPSTKKGNEIVEKTSNIVGYVKQYNIDKKNVGKKSKKKK